MTGNDSSGTEFGAPKPDEPEPKELSLKRWDLLMDSDLAGTSWRLYGALLEEKGAVIDGSILYDLPEQPHPPTGNVLDEGRWFLLIHRADGTRLFLRVQRQEWTIPNEVRITGAIFAPKLPGAPITGQMLRDVPIAKIELRINRRLFPPIETFPNRRGDDAVFMLTSGKTIRYHDLLQPIGNPKRVEDFYEIVALQHQALARDEYNPTAKIAEINGVALTTAQGWVARARRRGLLPPGRRGRPG